MSKFGEPWGIHYHSLVPQTRVRMYWLRPPTDDHAPLSVGCENVAPVQRIVACVNALAGVEDPAAALQAAREALTEASAYCEDRADADHDGVDYVANDEMKLGMEIDRALRLLTPKEDNR